MVAAAWDSSRACSLMPYSARTQGIDPKLLVSTTWQPTSKNDLCRSAMTSGLVSAQNLVTALERRPAEIVRAEGARLQVGAGGPVENDEGLVDGLDVAGRARCHQVNGMGDAVLPSPVERSRP